MTKICVWNRAVAPSDVPLGISKDEAERRALHMLETLSRGDGASPPLSLGEDLPDVLHALVQEMARRESTSEGHYKALRDLHRLIAELAWPFDEFAEKAQLLAHISQLAWSQCLQRGSALEVSQWEQECLKYFLLQADARQLVGMAVANWSPAVCERFLTDRVLVLALCVWLRTRADSTPRVVFELASVFYGWLSTHRGSNVRGDEAYLLTELTCLAAGASRLCGLYSKSRDWLLLAEKGSEIWNVPPALRARIEYVRLSVLYDTHQCRLVLSQVSHLIERFEQLGLQEDTAKSKFLLALVQKEIVGDEQAFRSFALLESDPTVRRLPWLKALVLINLAELQSRAGDLGAARGSLNDAELLLTEAKRPFGLGFCYGVAAEILRDHGSLSAAVDYYRLSVQQYAVAGMEAYAAYVRIVLAETLVATGRDEEGVEEILAALPTIERESLVQEGIAAMGLLKVSLSRRRLDPAALKALRESLDRSRRGLA